MRIKFVQINIYKGKYLDALVQFLQKENADVVSMQEVTSCRAGLGRDKLDLFIYLKKKLRYVGVLVRDYDVIGNQGYMGNAILTKHELVDSKSVCLKEYQVLDFVTSNDPKFWVRGPRHLLDASIKINSSIIHALSVHGAWTAPPVDTPETIRQAHLIAEHLKELEGPYLLGGDFNAVIQSKTIEIISKICQNLMFGSGVLETTNPKVHKIAPRGYLIDYIFASGHFKLRKLVVPKVTISDHLPVVAELEL